MKFIFGTQNIGSENAGIILDILNQRLEDRKVRPFVEGVANDADLLYVVDPQYTTEEYSIYDRPGGGLKITGSSLLAFLFGTGKMLRTAHWGGESGFSFGKWRGRTAPRCVWRDAYLSCHLFNTYHVASEKLVLKYIEDVVLMGYNAFTSANGINSYPSLDDERIPEHMAMVNKYKQRARQLGMKLCGGLGGNCVNHVYPPGNKATPTGLAQYGNEVCPSSEGGIKLILDYRDAMIKRFGMQDYDLLTAWPYDQGGCGCSKCAPWGCNGFMKMSEALAKHSRELYPHASICVSTWLFDFPVSRGEWEGLYRYLESGKGDWIDILMADSHTEFPKYPLEHPLPNGIKLMTFPEISMINRYPWGGFGANPMPKRFSRLWSQSSEISCGGRIYSEGIYEDFNKALYASFFWNGNNDVEETFREYANYELGITDVESFKRLVEIMEQNHQEPLRWWLKQGERYPAQMITKNGWTSTFVPRLDTAESLDLCHKIEAQQPEWARHCWRWRLLAIRAQLDHDITTHNGNPSPACEPLLDELFEIYELEYIQDTPVSPLSNKWISYHLKSLHVPVDDVLPDDLKKK